MRLFLLGILATLAWSPAIAQPAMIPSFDEPQSRPTANSQTEIQHAIRAPFIGTETVLAQPASATRKDEVTDLFAFFTGSWDCAGAFADGRPLEADLSFTPELEGRAIRYEHVDRPPNTYLASAMWSWDTASGKLVSLSVSTVADTTITFPSLFVGDPWTSRSVTFVADTLLVPPFAPNRFRYEAEDADRFRMTWEVQRDGSWEMGDYLVCRREKN